MKRVSRIVKLRRPSVIVPTSVAVVVVLSSADAASASAAAAAQINYNTVALSNTTASNVGPNQGPGVSFSAFGAFGEFEHSVLGDGGQVAFEGFLTGSGVTTETDSGIWLNAGAGAGPRAIAREGVTDPTGVAAGQTFSSFRTTSLNTAGAVAFRATLKGVGVNNTNEEGIWTTAGGGLTLVAREGTPGPGPGLGGDIVFSTFSGPHVNDAGKIVVAAQVRGTGVNGSNSEVLWSNVGGSAFSVIARSGVSQAALGGASIASFRAEPQLNTGGNLLFMATLQGSGVNTTNDSAILSRTAAGTLTTLARTGSGGPGPNLGAGVNFSAFDDFFTPVQNDAGTAVFRAVVTGTGIDTTNNQAVFRKPAGGAIAAVARTGSAGPGPQQVLGADTQFAYFLNPAVNESDDVALVGGLSGAGVTAANNTSIWATSANTLRLIAREGSETHGPGLGAGITFGEITDVNRPLIDDDGDIAWSATLTGAGITTFNDNALFANVGGATTLIAREGSAFDIDPGPGVDLRTVNGLAFYTSDVNDRGRASAFSGDGLITFRASFLEGGNGVFTAQVVPEPATAAAGAVVSCLTAALLRRRRRHSRASIPVKRPWRLV